jgi:hypothetical protein
MSEGKYGDTIPINHFNERIRLRSLIQNRSSRIPELWPKCRERYANPSLQFSDDESVVVTVRAACDPVTGTEPVLSSRGCSRSMIERCSNTG